MLLNFPKLHVYLDHCVAFQNELASLQGRMSALQQEAERNHHTIGEMKDAVQGFIDHDTKSHQRLMDILNAAQQELSMKPKQQPLMADNNVASPGGMLPHLANPAQGPASQEAAQGQQGMVEAGAEGQAPGNIAAGEPANSSELRFKPAEAAGGRAGVGEDGKVVLEQDDEMDEGGGGHQEDPAEPDGEGDENDLVEPPAVDHQENR